MRNEEWYETNAAGWFRRKWLSVLIWGFLVFLLGSVMVRCAQQPPHVYKYTEGDIVCLVLDKESRGQVVDRLRDGRVEVRLIQKASVTTDDVTVIQQEYEKIWFEGYEVKQCDK